MAIQPSSFDFRGSLIVLMRPSEVRERPARRAPCVSIVQTSAARDLSLTAVPSPMHVACHSKAPSAHASRVIHRRGLCALRVIPCAGPPCMWIIRSAYPRMACDPAHLRPRVACHPEHRASMHLDHPKRLFTYGVRPDAPASPRGVSSRAPSLHACGSSEASIRVGRATQGTCVPALRVIQSA